MNNTKIDEAAINAVKSKFELVADRIKALFGSMILKALVHSLQPAPEVCITMRSKSDMNYTIKMRDDVDPNYGVSDGNSCMFSSKVNS